jgi:hypothetical protein
MSGRPVRLLVAATIAAAASLASISAASAGCYSCGSSYAPVAYYTAPVVYSYSYSYAASCGCTTSYSAPMYVVNQGPDYYNAPVTLPPEDSVPTTYDYGYRQSYPYYSDRGIRWHRRHWHRGYYGNYRSHRYGYRGHDYRSGYRGFTHRGWNRGHRPYAPNLRYGMRNPMARPHTMPHRPMHWQGTHRNAPGFVHPR